MFPANDEIVTKKFTVQCSNNFDDCTPYSNLIHEHAI